MEGRHQQNLKKGSFVIYMKIEKKVYIRKKMLSKKPKIKMNTVFARSLCIVIEH